MRDEIKNHIVTPEGLHKSTGHVVESVDMTGIFHDKTLAFFETEKGRKPFVQDNVKKCNLMFARSHTADTIIMWKKVF